MVASLELGGGFTAIVDDCDGHLLTAHRWNAMRRGDSAYVAYNNSPGKPSTVYLHRVIMGAKQGQIVDHINRDKLDNRRCNLRFATKSQNAVNQWGKRTHGYRGVYFNRLRGKWCVTVMHMREKHWGGTYLDIMDAARAADDLAIRLHGEFAVLNFPQNAES